MLFIGRNLYTEYPRAVHVKPYRQNVYKCINKSDIQLSELIKVCKYLNYQLIIRINDFEFIDLMEYEGGRED